MPSIVKNQTGFPPLFLNAYVASELNEFDLIPDFGFLTPIIPANGPVNLEDLYNDETFIKNNPEALVIMYDRLARFRPNSFYRHKREQLVYFLYSTNMSKLFDGIRVITECLDREDSAAQDLNSWISANPQEDDNGNAIPNNVFFHNIKVYQADESRDLVELASARTLFLNKLIIEYDYHTTGISRYT